MGSKRGLGFLQIILASICFGFLGIFGKAAFENNISVGELLSYRFLLAAFLLWIFLTLFRPDWTRVTGREFIISGALGIFGYAVFATLYFTAVKGLSVALAALLLYTYPLWVQLIAVTLGDRPSPWQTLCTGIAFTGLVFLLWGQITVTSGAYILSGLGSAVAYAIYIVVSEKYQNTIRPITSSLYVMTFTAFALLVLHKPQVDRINEATPLQAGLIFGIAIVCTIVPMTLVLASLQKLKKTEVALVSIIEPLTAAIASWFVFNEKLTPLQVIGGILILAGLGLRFRERTEVIQPRL